MKSRILLLMLFEAATFAAASLVHSGLFIAGYDHDPARVAEAVIAAVLLAGAAASWIRPAWTRAATLGAQVLALVGTLVGIFTIILGVGPRTIPDVIYHIAIVGILGWGVVLARRLPSEAATRSA